MKKKYSMLVFSRPVEGREEEYLSWYSGQHIHDLMQIPGYVGCRFYKVTNAQLFGTKEDKHYQYLMVWDWETDDVEALMNDMRQRKADGRSKVCGAFAEQLNFICMPLTEQIDQSDICGLNVDEVAEFSQLMKNAELMAQE